MTREEAIAYILEWLKDEYALNSKDRKALNTVIKALDQEQKWISVSEQLPKDGADYLVIDAEGAYGVGFWRGDAQVWDSTEWGWLERSDQYRDFLTTGMGKVVAWMPLPEPYKKESEE